MLQDTLTTTNMRVLECQANALGMEFAQLEISVRPFLPKDDADIDGDADDDSDDHKDNSDDNKASLEFKHQYHEQVAPRHKKRRLMTKTARKGEYRRSGAVNF